MTTRSDKEGEIGLLYEGCQSDEDEGGKQREGGSNIGVEASMRVEAA